MVQVLVLSSTQFETFTHKGADGMLRVWDVTRGHEIAQRDHELLRFPLCEYDLTPEEIKVLYPGINEQHAMTTDLKRPLLFIPYFGQIFLLDGWHRTFKAVCRGVPELPMYLLTPEEAKSILLCELSPEEQRGCSVRCAR